MIIQGVKSTLTSNFTNPGIKFTSKSNYQKGIDSIRSLRRIGKGYDIIFIDIDLYQLNPTKLILAENYATQIKLLNPNSKIVLIIRRKENFRINKIIKTIEPDGFIIENEFNYVELCKIFNSITNDRKYLSPQILDSILNYNESKHKIDPFQMEILFFLSKGVKTKNLVNYLGRSLSTIEKNKYELKDVLNAKTDKELVEKAIEERIL